MLFFFKLMHILKQKQNYHSFNKFSSSLICIGTKHLSFLGLSSGDCDFLSIILMCFVTCFLFMLTLAYDRLLELELQQSHDTLELVLDCFGEVDSSFPVFCLLCVPLECSSECNRGIVQGCASYSLRLILRRYIFHSEF